MSQIWEINGLSLELDTEDYETAQKYKMAFEKMETEEKALKKDGSAGEFIKNYSLLFYHLFDNLFGKGTGEKIFKGKYNSRVCDGVYADFLNFVKNQQIEAANRRNDFVGRYIPQYRNRNQRRHEKR